MYVRNDPKSAKEHMVATRRAYLRDLRKAKNTTPTATSNEHEVNPIARGLIAPSGGYKNPPSGTLIESPSNRKGISDSQPCGLTYAFKYCSTVTVVVYLEPALVS